MDPKAQEYLRLYNELDAILQNRYNDFDRSHSQIMRYANELSKSPYSAISERGRKLNLIRQIRNLMIHDLDMNKDGLIEISESLIDSLRFEVNTLNKPKTALSICTPISKIIAAKFDDTVIELLPKMIDAGYMQLPILNGDGTLFGVLSPNAILAYLPSHYNETSNAKLKDMAEYLPINKHICEYYGFIDKDASVEKVTQLFQSVYQKGKKLVMVFVTENGFENEPVLGILTSFDVVHVVQ